MRSHEKMQSKYKSYYKAHTDSHGRARELRKDETSAEWLFWQIVRNRKILGFKFKRQHPIGPFYADFYCHDAKLVIELDGDIHDAIEIQKRDAWREGIIKDLGLTIMRFTNDDVFKNSHLINKAIEDYLSGFEIKVYPTSDKSSDLA